MAVSDKLIGKDADKIPNWSFKIMAFLIKITGKLMGVDKCLDEFGIKPGFTVVDYGCGPANYVKKASELVGESGKILAVDIHPLAETEVNKKVSKYNLQNVEFVLADGCSCAIEEGAADMIYALDMFHMVKDHQNFLKELHRILKNDGVLILEDGHQPRELSQSKLKDSGLWDITSENKRYMKCSPK